MEAFLFFLLRPDEKTVDHTVPEEMVPDQRCSFPFYPAGRKINLFVNFSLLRLKNKKG